MEHTYLPCPLAHTLSKFIIRQELSEEPSSVVHGKCWKMPFIRFRSISPQTSHPLKLQFNYDASIKHASD